MNLKMTTIKLSLIEDVPTVTLILTENTTLNINTPTENSTKSAENRLEYNNLNTQTITENIITLRQPLSEINIINNRKPTKIPLLTQLQLDTTTSNIYSKKIFLDDSNDDEISLIIELFLLDVLVISVIGHLIFISIKKMKI